MTVRFCTRRGDDADLQARMIAIARERRRFGYRRLHVMLKREGHLVNHKKLFRLYREEKLAVRRRSGRKRAIGTRAPLLIPLRPNQRWSLDFVSDQFRDGRRCRILAIVDDCTRENMALVADTSLSGLRVARELDCLVAKRGKPKMIVSDNGSEFTSNAILGWADRTRVEWHYIAPGKPLSAALRLPAGHECGTASSRASPAASGTTCSMRRCSHPCPLPWRAWPDGVPITMAAGCTGNSTGKRQTSLHQPSHHDGH